MADLAHFVDLPYQSPRIFRTVLPLCKYYRNFRNILKFLWDFYSYSGKILKTRFGICLAMPAVKIKVVECCFRPP